MTSSHPYRLCIICSRDMNVVGHDGHEMCPACCRRKRYREDIEFRRRQSECSKKWLKKNPDKRRQFHLGYRRQSRIQALKTVGHGIIECTGCGCIDTRIIEINHMNGGGAQEAKKRRDQLRFYLDIISGKRQIEDLNLLCKVCNIAHYVQLKYGIKSFEIIYNRGDN